VRRVRRTKRGSGCTDERGKVVSRPAPEPATWSRTLLAMRAVFIEAPEDLLRTRRDHGLDHRDEMWEGELHVVPPAGGWHQRLASHLLLALGVPARAESLEVMVEAGFFDPARPAFSYRVPDLVVARPEHCTARGVEGGAILVTEIRSPNDESYAKLPFYGAHGVERVVIIDRASYAIDCYQLAGPELVSAERSAAGRFALGFADLSISTVHDDDGPGLLVERTGRPDHTVTIWRSEITGERPATISQ
jgi:Uma2 family endonuclease